MGIKQRLANYFPRAFQKVENPRQPDFFDEPEPPNFQEGHTAKTVALRKRLLENTKAVLVKLRALRHSNPFERFFTRNKPTSERAPAHGLLSILELIYTKKTFEHIFKQTIDDLRDEHYQYLQEGKKWPAFFARLRIYPIVFFTCISLLGAKFIKQFIAVLK